MWSLRENIKGLIKQHTLHTYSVTKNRHFQCYFSCCYYFHDSKTLFTVRLIHYFSAWFTKFVKFLRLSKLSFRCSFVNKMADETGNSVQYRNLRTRDFTESSLCLIIIVIIIYKLIYSLPNYTYYLWNVSKKVLFKSICN